jgi:hypothetical protein
MNITMKRVVLIISVALMFVMISASSYAATVTYSASALADQGLTGTRTLKGLATSIGSSKQATIVLSHTSSGNTTTYSMSQSVTLTSNITLKIEKGAVLSIAVGKTLTMNGKVEAGDYQIFSGEGTVTVPGVLKAEWFGIVPDFVSSSDTGTDNTAAFEWAISCMTEGQKIEFGAGKFGFGSAVDVSKRITISGVWSRTISDATVDSTGLSSPETTFNFVGTDGLILYKAYTTIDGVGVYNHAASVAITDLDPASHVFGDAGIKTDPDTAKSIGQLMFNRVVIRGFNTGLLLYTTDELVYTGYNRFVDCQFLYNNIGLASFYNTYSNFMFCDFRNNTLHGQFLKNSSGVRFIGGLSESNGNGLWNVANPERIGTYILNTGISVYDSVTFDGHYFEAQTIFDDSGVAVFKDCHMGFFRNVLGKGGLVMDYIHKSPNLAPLAIGRYTKSSGSITVTPGTDNYRVQYDGSGTALTLTSPKYTFAEQGMLVSELQNVLMGLQFKMGSDQSANGFRMHLTSIIIDSDGTSQTLNAVLAYPPTFTDFWDYSETDDWQGVQCLALATSSLDSTKYVRSVQLKISIVGTNFDSTGGGTALDIYVRNPSMYLYTNKAISYKTEQHGTWTPTLAFGSASTGITYGTQAGYYTITPDGLVWATASLTLTSKGSATGTAKISLPFNNRENYHVGGSVGNSSNLAAGTIPIGAMVYADDDFAQILDIAGTYMTQANFENNSSITVTVVYRTDI